MRRIAAVVLAAGASTRLQEPKQLVRIGKENLLERAVRIAGEAGCSPVTVVLGASAEKIRSRSNLDGCEVVVNKDWASGMGTSIGTGIRSLEEVDGAIVMTCDMPAVTAKHLQALMASEKLTASGYAGRHGVPAYFPASMFPLLMELQGDTGAKTLLQSAQAVALPGGELDMDTKQDVEQAKALYGE